MLAPARIWVPPLTTNPPAPVIVPLKDVEPSVRFRLLAPRLTVAEPARDPITTVPPLLAAEMSKTASSCTVPVAASLPDPARASLPPLMTVAPV